MPGVTPKYRCSQSYCWSMPAMVDDVEDEEWQHLNHTNWRGLGLADPIKNVEVRLFRISPLRTTLIARPTGQVALAARLP